MWKKNRSWFVEDDVLIVDRRFSDAVDLMEGEYGLNCKMPTFLVEYFNSRLKQLKYMDKVVPNSQIPAISYYVRLIGNIFKYKSNNNRNDDYIVFNPNRYYDNT